MLTLTIEEFASRHKLSGREAEVAFFCAEGLTNVAMAQRMRISPETVKFHLKNIFTKVGVERRAQLIVLIYQQLAEDRMSHSV